MKKILWFLGFVALLCSFLLPQHAKAAEQNNYQDVIINELMWTGSSKSSYDEWIELYNTTDHKIDLSGWQLTNTSGVMLTIPSNRKIYPHDYFLISNYDLSDTDKTILYIQPDLVDAAISLSNTTLQITLLDINSNLIDVAGSAGVPLAGNNASPKLSMQRNDVVSDGAIASSWHSAVESKNLISTATEKATPTNSSNTPPSVPVILTPHNEQKIVLDQTLYFTWTNSIDLQNDAISYQLEFSCSDTFDPGIIFIDITANNYDLKSSDFVAEVGECLQYYWRVSVSDGEKVNFSLPSSFFLTEPIYSDAIVINELTPNPIGSDSTGEWIELYNNSQDRVNLKNWIFQDSGLSQHKILNDLFIEPWSYLLIYRKDSGLSLNNDGDMVQLYQPNNKLLSDTSFGGGGGEGLSWARGPDGTWAWTTTLTAGGPNIISLPIAKEIPLELDPVINTVPIEIQTGDFENYLDKLVKITGEVTSTSGSTFYLDDGSGEVKVYIQEKTGIDKLEMHKGDIFQIVGIVDTYGQTWRILPQKNEDIKLIENATKVSAKKTTVKKVAAKTVTAVKEPIVKKAVAAAATSTENKNNNKVGVLDQIVKASTGLAIILLVFLIMKILRRSKEKSSRYIGGHFGEDET